MSYLDKIRSRRNTVSVIFSLLAIFIAFALGLMFTNNLGFSGDYNFWNQVLIPIIYFAVMFVLGIIITLIAYKKDGIIIGFIFSIIYQLTIFIIYANDKYRYVEEIFIQDIVLLFSIPFGVIFLLLGVLVGCRIKVKAGGNFTMPRWEKIWKFILD